MTSTPSFAFRTGGAVAEAAEEEARAAASSRRKTGPDYFALKKDGDQMVVRFLTDDPEWIIVDQHSFIPTKPGPADAENFPESMTGVCRYDKAFGGFYKDCYIDDAKLKNTFGKPGNAYARVWALGVEREIVKGDGTQALGGPERQGMVVGIRDKIIEIEETGADGKPTGNVLKYPKIIVINQPMSSFFGHMRAMYGLYKTVCDRDYIITREGEGRETVYRPTSLEPIADLKPGTPKWENYLQVLAERKIDLGALVAEKASDEYYARYFDPRYAVDDKGNVVAASAVPATGLADLSATGPAYSTSLKDKIRAMGAAAAAPAQDTPPY